MAEPNVVIASTGAAIASIVTLAIGQLLGEYVIIFIMGFLGTLIALSEVEKKPIFKTLTFLSKGILFSVLFTGIITSFLVPYLPPETGLTAYAILGAVSFMIGWSSNKLPYIRDKIVDLFSRKTDSDN
jgi:uncharacterized membrane-anchored protein